MHLRLLVRHNWSRSPIALTNSISKKKAHDVYDTSINRCRLSSALAVKETFVNEIFVQLLVIYVEHFVGWLFKDQMGKVQLCSKALQLKFVATISRLTH